jgi:prepilin-type N-terminal cleavage/methylation domain-containing protein
MRRGFTIIEVLIALAILGIAFSALLMSQLSDLRTTARMRLVTEVKSALTQVLEGKTAEILAKTGNSATVFAFYDYYWGCPTPVSGASAIIGRPLNSVTCQGTSTAGRVEVTWTIAGESGLEGEGLILLTARGEIPSIPNSPRVSLVHRVSCYDVYPSPTKDAPAPCPKPESTGGGRP